MDVHNHRSWVREKVKFFKREDRHLEISSPTVSNGVCSRAIDIDIDMYMYLLHRSAHDNASPPAGDLLI